MRKSWGGLIGVLFICGLFLGEAPQALAKEKEVVIGYIGPLTGGAAFLGVDALNGCLLAAEEINAAGGITVAGQKYKVKIESYDDEATPAKAVTGLRKLKDLYYIPVVVANVSGSVLALLEINDTGVGFDVSDVMSSYEKRGSLGMINLQERADLVNGLLNIDSAPGKGTCVRVLIPLTEKAADLLQRGNIAR